MFHVDRETDVPRCCCHICRIRASLTCVTVVAQLLQLPLMTICSGVNARCRVSCHWLVQCRLYYIKLAVTTVIVASVIPFLYPSVQFLLLACWMALGDIANVELVLHPETSWNTFPNDAGLMFFFLLELQPSCLHQNAQMFDRIFRVI